MNHLQVLGVVLGLVGVSRAVYGYVRHWYSPPSDLLSGSHEEFLELRYPYLYSKVFEVLFQQSLLVCLVGLFVLDGLSPAGVIVGFVVVNTVLHVGQVLRIGWWFGLFYIVSGFLSSFVFPALYLFVGSGHVVAFVVHYAFYIVCGALAWVYAETLQ